MAASGWRAWSIAEFCICSTTRPRTPGATSTKRSRYDPQQPEALLGKAIEQWQDGNGAGAVELATRSLQYGPKRPAVAYLIRGLANEQQGQLRAAYADLQTARQIEPNWAEPGEQLQRYRVVRR